MDTPTNEFHCPVCLDAPVCEPHDELFRLRWYLCPQCRGLYRRFTPAEQEALDRIDAVKRERSSRRRTTAPGPLTDGGY